MHENTDIDYKALWTDKEAILNLLLEKEGYATLQTDSIPLIERTGALPLSFAQQRLWFLSQLEGESATYNMSSAVRLTGYLDITALERAVQEIVGRHEVLRTAFETVNGVPIQRIYPTVKVPLPVLNLQKFSEAEQLLEVQRLAAEEAQRHFELVQVPLLRVTLLRLSENSHVLLLTAHHIICDGWSTSIFFQEMATLYEAFLQGLPSPLSELPIQYADFAHWQRQWLKGKVLEDQLTYWRRQLAGAPPLLSLPTDYPRPPIQTFRGRTKQIELGITLTQKLEALSQELGISLFMTLMAAFATFLARCSGQDDVVIGSPIANRNRNEIEPLIGFFVNTLVLRTNLQGDPSFVEVLKQVQQVALDAYANQDVPFEQLVEELNPDRNLSYSPVFQVGFSLENTSTESMHLPGLTLTPLKVESVTAKYDLTLSVQESELGLVGSWEYNSDLFDETTITRMVGHFLTLLEGIVADPQQRITQLPLLNKSEQDQILIEWNNTQADYPKNTCIHQLFETQVELTPDAVAVVFGDRQLTYRQLNSRANQLARHLQRLGVKPEVLVGICVERSVDMVVALLAVLKAGGAFLPLDPSYPQERLTFMLSDSQAPVLLTHQGLAAQFAEQAIQSVCLDTDWGMISQESEQTPTSAVNSENLAYVIYTSGSTGKSKGVLVAHQGLCNLAVVQIQIFGVKPESRVLQFASFSFDAAISEIAMALCSGARLCLGSKDSLLPGAPLIERLQQQAITHITLPPSALAVLPAEELPALQTLIVAGEACPQNLVEQWSSKCRFFNAYGPTETTVCATTAECVDDDQKPSIGRPIANTQVYILDKHLQPLPIGVPGELHIGGVGLARGYLNRPELTKERFIPNPFNNSKFKIQNSKLYKTGDLARYLPDGNIEFLGRIDNQVKIRGFRIEPGEIASILLQNPEVQEAVVIDREDNPGQKRLVAYVVPNQDRFNQLSRPEGQAELWPSVAEFYVYDELLYSAMTNDWRRNHSYKVAINQLVKDKIVVEIGTGKDAILARLCAEAGARKVYAIEREESTCRLAESCVQSFGLSDKISIIHGDATLVTLPELADVCVSEIVGPIGGCEGAAVITNNAWRLLKQDAVMIPERSVTKIAAVTLPDEILKSPGFANVPGHYTQKIFDQVGYPFDLRVCIKKFPQSNLLSNADIFEDLDFRKAVDIESSHEINLTIAKNGRLDGFLVWLNLHTIAGEVIDILEYEYCWLPVYLPVFEPSIKAAAGDIIQGVCIRTLCDNKLNPDFLIKGNLIKKSGEVVTFEYASHHYKNLFRQTPFYQRLFDEDGNFKSHNYSDSLPKSLRNYLRNHLPDYMVPSSFVKLDALPLTPNGKVDRHALPVPELSRVELGVNFVAPQTSTEETLAEIWAQVLQVEQVGIHDNFFELGGDSILSIQIVARANQAGLQLTTKQLFQHQTVAQLATVAGIIDSVQAEQGIVTGLVPLTPIHCWFFEQNQPHPHHFNMAFLLETSPELKPEFLEAVVQQLLSHHDALRLRYVAGNSILEQKNVDVETEDYFTVVNISELTQDEQQATIETIAAKKQVSLNLAEGPLLQVVLFKSSSNQSGRLLFVIHHLAIDGVSWRILLEDLVTAYQQLDRGEPIQLPPKTTSFKDWANRLTEYAQSKALATELEYWLAASNSDIDPLPVDYPLVKGANTVLSAHTFSVSLNEEETHVLLKEISQVYNTQINDLLLTALVHSFAKWTGNCSLLVSLEGHGREDLFEGVDLSRTIGWFTSLFPIKLTLPENAHYPGDAIKSIKEQLRRVPNRGIGYGILRYLNQDAVTRSRLEKSLKPEVSFNYLGQFDQIMSSPPILGLAQESSGSAQSSLGYRSHLLEVNGFVQSGRLQMDWTYSEKVHRRSTVESLAQSFIETLKSLIFHCQLPETGGYTPSDFPDIELNQEKLDQYLAEIDLANLED